MATGYKADANLTIGTSVDVGGIDTGLYRINRMFKKMGKLAGAVVLGKVFITLGKAAVEAASDLQEVQNIIDHTFKEWEIAADGTSVVVQDMTDKIEKFADTSIAKFGLSALAAKQTAGSFMAMGNAMGLTMDEASDMAVQLTALTGDFASFYNLQQDYARTALSAVYTGETETLKRYGIIITEANLQQYANTLGIKQNVKQMSARNKLLLRYKYIMEVMQKNNVEGDFERTATNWANSWRVLKEVWNQLMIAIGDGVITILSPVVNLLNAIIKKLIQFTNVFWQIASSVFGIKLQSFTEEVSNVSDATSTLVDYEEDLADSVDDTTKSIQKALQPFDELNNLTTTTSSDTISDEDLLNLDIDLSKYYAAAENAENLVANSFWDLGRQMAQSVLDSLESIDWASVYSGIMRFGKSIADYLNGAVSTELIPGIGTFIAKALNAVVYGVLTFASTMNWDVLGIRIGQAINNFFTTFDFEAFGATIRLWAKGLLTTVSNIIDTINWSDIFTGIRKFFSGLSLDGFMAISGLLLLHTLFRKGISLAFSGIESVITGAMWTPVFKKIKDTLAEKAAASGGAIVASTVTTIAGYFAIIGGSVASVVAFIDQWKNGFNELSSIVLIISSTLVGIGLVMAGLASWPAIILAACVGLLAEIVILIKDNWDTICGWFSGINDWFTELKDFIVTTFIEPISEKFDGLTSNIGGFFYDCWLIIQAAWIIASEWFTSHVITPIKDKFSWLKQIVGSLFTAAWESVKLVWGKAITFFGNVTQGILKVFKPVIDTIGNLFDVLWKGVRAGAVTVVNLLASGFERFINGIVNTINLFIKAFNLLAYGAGVITGKQAYVINTLPNVSIPRLAQGAVIPPNHEFMAILGDQKQGTNIETPLATMKQAFLEALSEANIGGSSTVEVYLEGDAQGIFKLVRTQDRQYAKSTGHSAFA